MSVNSKQKGSRVERGACKLLESFGYEARRAQQYSGVKVDDSSADIITNVKGVRFEIKGGYNDGDLYTKQVKEWIQTAIDETPEGQTWAILWKKDYRPWMIIFPATINGKQYPVKSDRVEQIIKDVLEHE